MNLRSCLPLALLLLVGCPTATEPICGDGELQEGEECDDGGLWGGDGCTHLCTSEDAGGESEPNDEPDDAGELAGSVYGSLLPGDRDCFAVDVPAAGAVRATVSSIEGAGCAFEMLVELIDPEGERATSALPTSDGACPAIDPATDTWARYLVEGEHVVCVEALLDDVAPTYRLDVAVADSCADLEPLEPDPSQDHEGDGVADVCDPDDDDDGVDDDLDNCPLAPNGPEQPFPWSTADQGFVNLWLLLGPFDGETPGDCEPSVDDFADPAGDGEAAPVLGDVVEDLPWFAAHHVPGDSAAINFNAHLEATAPREAYAFTWVHAPEARDAVLAIGTDDGHRVWLNGAEVATDVGCHGVATDGFRYPVSLDEGWNRLLIKVFDGGGGWGLIARFYETDEETQMLDLELSIGGAEPWVDDQGDADGDGLGDFCDPEP